MKPFEITSAPAEQGRPARIAVRGDLDAYRGGELRTVFEELIASGRQPIELEASGVCFMDTGGLRVLVEADDRLREEGNELMLVDPSAAVLRLLRFTGLRERFVGR